MSTILYASIDGRVNLLANQEVVFYDPLRDQAHVMATQVLQALDLCRPFRSLEQHVAVLAGALQGLGGREDAIRRVLESLVARGLLLSDEHWIDQLGRGGHREVAPLAGVFIRAKGPPQRLRGLLDSLLAYETTFAPGHRYVLLEVGTDDGQAAERRALMEAFGKAAKVRTHCVGRDVPARVAALLQGEVADTKASAHLLRGGEGAARNMITLLSAGHRYALLDDGMRLPFHRHTDLPCGLDVGARSVGDFAWLDDVDAAWVDGQPFDEDPLQWHLRVCGAALGDLVNRVPGFELGRKDLDGLVPSHLRKLHAKSRVLATATGVRGAVTPGPWLFQLDAGARAGFSADRDRYLQRLGAPAVRRLPSRVQLYASGVPDMSLLFDNAEPTPCVPATGEGADRLFASQWCAMYPEALSAHFPMTIASLAGKPEADWLKRPLNPLGNDFLADTVARVMTDIRASDPWARLGTVSAHLHDLAGASDVDLRAELREYQAFTRSTLIQSLQRMFEASEASAPLHWQADLRQLIEANGRALIDTSEPRLADVENTGSGEHALRHLLERQAMALDVWPALWQAARERGEQLWKQI